jgi:hypothetical protein
MSFFDVFNLSFVVYLGILILCLSLLFVYFESKLREQNHKMLHMLEIVTTLSNEIHMSQPQIETHTPFHFNVAPVEVIKNTTKLIDVSDGDEEDDDLEEEEEYVDDDEELEEEEPEDLENESESDYEEDVAALAEELEIEDDDDDESVVKEDPVVVVKLSSEANKPEASLADDFDFSPSNDPVIFDDFKKELGPIDEEDNISISSISSLKETVATQQIDDNASVSSDLVFSDVPFKNMSINKLRRLAQEKGLVQGNVRLKKPELVALLEKGTSNQSQAN